MGGSFGGMMMRHANNLGLHYYSPYDGFTRPENKPSWAQQVSDETQSALRDIQLDHERARRLAIIKFLRGLEEHQELLMGAGLLKPDDTSLMQIICRAKEIPFRRRKLRKTRYA